MESTKSYLLKVVKSIIVIATLLALLALVQIVNRGNFVEFEIVLPIMFLIIYLLSVKFEVKLCKLISIIGIILSMIGYIIYEVIL